jgi:GSH-dependent disulfide-bond oxidoreductase
MIDLHYVSTGNNLKIAIMLEETGLAYRLVKYDMFAGTHLTPQFRKVNPNNKLPAIVDHDPEDAAGPFAVFESGAILLYLAEKSGKLLPQVPGATMACLAGRWTWADAWSGASLCSLRA